MADKKSGAVVVNTTVNVTVAAPQVPPPHPWMHHHAGVPVGLRPYYPGDMVGTPPVPLPEQNPDAAGEPAEGGEFFGDSDLPVEMLGSRGARFLSYARKKAASDKAASDKEAGDKKKKIKK